MATLKSAYQTQKYVNKFQNSPIYCGRNDNPWLTEGYYFWHGTVDLAHWWGKIVRKYNKYCIFSAEIEFNGEEYLDLVGNVSDIEDFRKTYSLLKEKCPFEEFTVSRILKIFLKINPDIKIVRAISQHKINSDTTIKFIDNDSSYLNITPAIQLCVMDINLIKNFNRVYPK